MVAYVIADIDVTDPEKYEVYKQLAPPAIAKHGGRYLARGGHMAVLVQVTTVVICTSHDE